MSYGLKIYRRLEFLRDCYRGIDDFKWAFDVAINAYDGIMINSGDPRTDGLRAITMLENRKEYIWKKKYKEAIDHAIKSIRYVYGITER